MRLAILVLFCAPLVSAQTIVTLAPEAAPATAEPAVTVVAVIGSGFPTGVILPSNVTVTLRRGGGPVTTQAIAVQQIAGTTDRVSFQVPRAIMPAKPTLYRISIAGVT